MVFKGRKLGEGSGKGKTEGQRGGAGGVERKKNFKKEKEVKFLTVFRKSHCKCCGINPQVLYSQIKLKIIYFVLNIKD